MPNVNLGPHFDRFVQEKLAEGRYQNASEVVRAGLRLPPRPSRRGYPAIRPEPGGDCGAKTGARPAYPTGRP